MPVGSSIELEAFVDTNALHNENQNQHYMREGKHYVTATVKGDYLPHGITTIQI